MTTVPAAVIEVLEETDVLEPTVAPSLSLLAIAVGLPVPPKACTLLNSKQ